MSGPAHRFQPTIRVTVVGIFLLATLITAVVAVGLAYHFSREMATRAALDRFDNLAGRTGQFLRTMDDRAVRTARILASYPSLVREPWEDSGIKELFAEMMRDNPMLYAIYLGFGNGDFYELINLNSGYSVRQQLEATPADRWVLLGIRGKGSARQRSYAYYDAEFRLRTARSEASDYNATTRPWYVQAVQGEVRKTAPYLFHNLQAPGQTYSTRVAGSDAVIAVDIALSTLSGYLATQAVEQGGEVFVYRQSGDIIASNQGASGAAVAIPPATRLDLDDDERALVAAQGVLKVSNEIDWAPIDFSIAGQPQGYSIDFLHLVAELTGLRFAFVNGFSWVDLLARFDAGDIDILQPVFDNGLGKLPGLYSNAFLDVPYAVVTRADHRPVTHIRDLEGARVAVPEGWSIIDVLRRDFPAIELEIVASGRAMFEAVRAGTADAGLDTGAILRATGHQYFYTDLVYHENLDFSPTRFPTELHLVLHERRSELMPLLNRAIAAVSDAQRAALAAKWLSPASTSPTQTAVPYAELQAMAQQPLLHRQLRREAIAGGDRYVYVTPVDDANAEFLGLVVPVATVLEPAMQQVRLAAALTVGALLLLAPAPWLFASPIVVPIRKLAQETEKIRERQYAALDIPTSRIREIDELGVSMHEMASTIEAHEARQEKLLDSFIQLIAQAIDQKSPYTAGHCARVPELAFMLAAQAEASCRPPFTEFRFETEQAWREFRVGAWLHDCGKITTPEHVVDKGTKLEVIHNRIHEIRMRFEVLWRDAEIRYLRRCGEEPAQEPRHHAELLRCQAQLHDDFAFVAAMNIGGEHLDDDRRARLHALAATTWTRHFSDRLGLSPVEEQRLPADEPPLPCIEPLLADKPEHILPRTHDTNYDPRLGIRMQVPEYLANRGELHNLCIARGTLTPEDRFTINEHIIATIRMLEALPLPAELAQVPRYASTHHETMKGTGYPRGLRGDDLSIPERIMVLADVFEALTAADRPYKKAKPVSVAIDILYQMVRDEHIDADVFTLFLRSGVYLDYARRFLDPAQIDEVDIDDYLDKLHAA